MQKKESSNAYCPECGRQHEDRVPTPVTPAEPKLCKECILPTVTSELLIKHFKGVRFKEIATDEQTFVDRVLATCFNDTDSSASWITKVEEARTDREEWYYIHGKTTKTDFVLNGVCVRTALNYWNPDLDTDLSPELANEFLLDCLYGPNHRKAN